MDIDKLISEIFVRPALWDQKNKNHHNRFVLDKLWDEVAVKMNTTRMVVRNKWKSLRDKFRTTMTSIPKSKSGDGQTNYYKGEWKYFKSLLFLKDQFTPRKSEGNFPKYGDENILDESSQMTQDESDTDDVSEQVVENCSMQSSLEQIEHSDSASYDIAPSSSQASRSARKHPQKRLSKDNIGQALLDLEKQKLHHLEQKKTKNDEDEDMNFFKSLLPHVRTFSAYDKMEYRMRVMKLTQDFLKPDKNPHPLSNYDYTTSGYQSTARDFYNDAARNINLSQSEPHLYEL